MKLRVMEVLGKPAATEALLIPEMRDPWIGHHVRIPGTSPIAGEHCKPDYIHAKVGSRVLGENFLLYPTGTFLADASCR